MLQAESQSESESPESTIFQRKKALQHAKLVREQMAQRLYKRRRLNKTGESKEAKVETFRFKYLPTEIRNMIYRFYFTSCSGEKPRLMWAFKINGIKVKGNFYKAAEKVYYMVNNWTFKIKDCLRNAILEKMDQYHIQLLRVLTIEIPKEIQPCTKFSTALLKPVNVNDLTLSVCSDVGVRRAIHEILHGFKRLQKITIIIHRPSQKIRPRHNDRLSAVEYYKLFRPGRDMLDRVLSHRGILVKDTARVQEWVWKTDSLGTSTKTFQIICPKMHIKFE